MDNKRQKYLDRKREYNRIHAEERREWMRLDRVKNPLKYQIKRKARYIQNREKALESAKEYRERLGDELRARKRKQYHDNLEKVRTLDRLRQPKKRVYYAYRYKNDLQYAVKRRLQARIHSALINQRDSKRMARTTELLGCSIKEVVIHLESKFHTGMTWENRSLWHIDHIKPCASFDLTDLEQQKVCFHYTNLQPLWGYENHQKHAKLDWVRGEV